jgi:hypothetical protein
MDLKNILLESIKYNLIAVLPTLLGASIFLFGVFLTVGLPISEGLSIIGERQLEWVFENQSDFIDQVISESMYIVGGLLIVIGYLIHRIGRSFFLFYYQQLIAKKESKENA